MGRRNDETSPLAEINSELWGKGNWNCNVHLIFEITNLNHLNSWNAYFRKSFCMFDYTLFEIDNIPSPTFQCALSLSLPPPPSDIYWLMDPILFLFF